VANLTLSVDDELLRRARIRALEEGTSVNALVRDYLERFTAGPAEDGVFEALSTIASRTSRTGPERRWTRDELHER
jgi:plasmid stability protein